MPAQQSTTQANARCWVWFKGGLYEGAHWRAGWYGAPSVLGGTRIEKTDYMHCRVADSRVTFHEPADMKTGPEIAADVQWGRLVPVDPK